MHVGIRLSGPFLRFVDAFERVEGKGGTPLTKGCMCVWSILVCVCVWCVVVCVVCELGVWEVKHATRQNLRATNS